jgi:hypothetical protein
MLTGVIYQYYETIKADTFKPDKILLYLLYSGELLFVFLFSPIFALTQFTAKENQVSELQSINFNMQNLWNKKNFLETILKSFILVGIFHVISLFSIYNNSFFSLPSFLMMIFLLFVCSFLITNFTFFLIVFSRNISFSVAVVYITIIGIFGCVFFISPLLDLLGNPTPLINLTLNINPMMAIASILDLSIFRLGPFYKITKIEMFEYHYPHWSIHVASYLMFSILFTVGTVVLRSYYITNLKNRKLS